MFLKTMKCNVMREWQVKLNVLVWYTVSSTVDLHWTPPIFLVFLGTCVYPLDLQQSLSRNSAV